MSQQRKAKFVSKKPAKTVYVDSTAQKEEEDSELSQTWIKIGAIELSKADKDILLHSRAWLNDGIIHATQVLLKNQVPVIGGLQEPGKGQVCSFNIEQGEFVQILHDGYEQWLMVSTIRVKNDGEVHVYDSMYSSVGTYTKKLLQYSKQSIQRLSCILWMCRCRWEGVIVAYCNCICNSYCEWRSPWQIYL